MLMSMLYDSLNVNFLMWCFFQLFDCCLVVCLIEMGLLPLIYMIFLLYEWLVLDFFKILLFVFVQKHHKESQDKTMAHNTKFLRPLYSISGQFQTQDKKCNFIKHFDVEDSCECTMSTTCHSFTNFQKPQFFKTPYNAITVINNPLTYISS